uniref:Uncharacterized protein n=1 Tax=Bracon brevicornis TaxID=1563983 RepID=A0A6V7KCP6_9HYME
MPCSVEDKIMVAIGSAIRACPITIRVKLLNSANSEKKKNSVNATITLGTIIGNTISAYTRLLPTKRQRTRARAANSASTMANKVDISAMVNDRPIACSHCESCKIARIHFKENP